MKNFIQPGETLDLTAPAVMASGEARLVGDFLGVAVSDLASGEKGPMLVEGVVKLPKLAGEAYSEGQTINWDDSNFRFQAATSDKDDAGKVVVAALSAATTVTVKLLQ